MGRLHSTNDVDILKKHTLRRMLFYLILVQMIAANNNTSTIVITTLNHLVRLWKSTISMFLNPTGIESIANPAIKITKLWTLNNNIKTYSKKMVQTVLLYFFIIITPVKRKTYV